MKGCLRSHHAEVHKQSPRSLKLCEEAQTQQSSPYCNQHDSPPPLAYTIWHSREALSCAIWTQHSTHQCNEHDKPALLACRVQGSSTALPACPGLPMPASAWLLHLPAAQCLPGCAMGTGWVQGQPCPAPGLQRRS